MRRRNRRVKKYSHFSSGATGVASLIVSSFIMVMIYWSLDARCTSILREIGAAEKQLKALESELGRETARWNGLKTRERLDEKITRFGLAMQSPQPDQVIRMNSSGKPAPGQLAFARARARSSKVDSMALAAPRKRGSVRR